MGQKFEQCTGHRSNISHTYMVTQLRGIMNIKWLDKITNEKFCTMLNCHAWLISEEKETIAG